MFNPAKMEYCETLFECLMTVTRYSLRPSAGGHNYRWDECVCGAASKCYHFFNKMYFLLQCFRWTSSNITLDYLCSLSCCMWLLLWCSPEASSEHAHIFQPPTLANTMPLSWTNHTDYKYLLMRILIDSTFWILFTVIGLNVVTSLILDGFRQLKVISSHELRLSYDL